MERALLLMVPMWSAVGACLLAIAPALGGRSRGRFVAVTSALLSMVCLIAGAAMVGGWVHSEPVPLLDQTLLTSRLVPDLLRVEWSVDAVGWWWCFAATASVTAILVAQCQRRTDTFDDGSAAVDESQQRAAQLGCLAAFQVLAFAQDEATTWLCGLTVIPLGAGLVRDAGLEAGRRFLWVGGTAIVLLMVSIGWMWHGFTTVDRHELHTLAATAVAAEDDVPIAQFRLIVTFLVSAALVGMGAIPFFMWTKDVVRSRQAAFPLGLGLLMWGAWLLFRSMPLFHAVDGDRNLLIGLPTITALLAGFTALTARTLSQAVGLAAVTWCAILAGGMIDPDHWAAVAQWIVSLPLMIVTLLIVAQAPWRSQRSGRLVGGTVVVMAASGGWGAGTLIAPGLQSLWQGDMGLLTAQSVGLLVGHSLIAFALTKEILRANEQEIFEATSTHRSIGSSVAPCLLTLLALVAVGLLVRTPDGATFGSSASQWIVAGGGLLGVFVGWCLYRRPSPFPQWLSQRCESIDRLSRRGMYLDDVATTIERLSTLTVEAWRAADTPMLSAQRESLASDVRPSSTTTSQEPVADLSAGWSAAAVLLTAIILWLVLGMT